MGKGQIDNVSLHDPDGRLDIFEAHYIIETRLKARGFADQAAWPELVIACREAAEIIAARLLQENNNVKGNNAD